MTWSEPVGLKAPCSWTSFAKRRPEPDKGQSRGPGAWDFCFDLRAAGFVHRSQASSKIVKARLDPFFAKYIETTPKNGTEQGE